MFALTNGGRSKQSKYVIFSLLDNAEKTSLSHISLPMDSDSYVYSKSHLILQDLHMYIVIIDLIKFVFIQVFHGIQKYSKCKKEKLLVFKNVSRLGN